MDLLRSAEPVGPTRRLDFHLRLTVIIAALMGYLVLFASGVYSWAYFPPVLAAIALGWLRFYDPRPPLFPELVWTLITLALVGGMMLLSFLGDLFFLDALNIIFLILPLIKLLTAGSERDYLQIYALAFGQMLYGTIVNMDLSFGFAMLAYMATTIWGLILLAFRSAVLTHPDQPELPERVEKAIFTRRYIGMVGALPIVALLMTLALFFIIPRPGSALVNMAFGIQKRFSGFADTVSIGELGEIKLNTEVVMRVQVSGPVYGRPFYWRGGVLDQFDGMTWVNTPFERLEIRPPSRRHVFVMSGWQENLLTYQRFFLDGIEAKYLFHADFIARARVMSPVVFLHASGTATLPKSRRNLQTYEVWSYPASAMVVPDDYMKRYLQLPETLDPRINALAQTLTKDQTGAFDSARAIERHLRNDYTYSLKAGLQPSADPLPHFLFESRQGHCEYFATAMVVLLRTLGIHARMVTGFQEGEYNAIEDYFIVRQSDAHTWVEAYLDKQWIRFDPTPAAGWESYAASFADDLRRLMDAVAFRWQRYIVYFTANDQIRALIEADHHVRMISIRGFKSWLQENGPTIAYILAAIFALLLIARARSMAARLSQWFSESPRKRALSKRYARLCKRLRKTGVRPRSGDTAADYLGRVGERRPELTPLLDQWLIHFHPIRYGARPLTSETIEILNRIEESIKDRLRDI